MRLGVAVGVPATVEGIAATSSVSVGVTAGMIGDGAAGAGVGMGKGVAVGAGVGVDIGTQAENSRVASKTKINVRLIVRVLL